MKHQKKVIIELKNVWKIYTGEGAPLNALRGIDLNVYEDDFVIILGKSGSGKSTLMNMIGLLDTPTKGKLLLDGEDIQTLSESTLAQIRGNKIGFIFQQFNLMPVLTAIENVSLPMLFQDIPSDTRLKRAKELLKLVGLQERMNHKPTELSGGEQQRVAIARALANNTEIILADEPTGNLDSNTGKQIMDLLSNLHEKEKKTIILVTHDINLIKYAHRTIYLKDGVILSDNHRIPKGE